MQGLRPGHLVVLGSQEDIRIRYDVDKGKEAIVPRKIRELKADLPRAGFTERAGKGSHTVWEHPLLPYGLTISGHDRDDARPYQEKDARAVIAAVRHIKEEQRIE